jgi:hypothetical protein
MVQGDPPITFISGNALQNYLNHDVSKSVLTQYFGGGMKPMTRKKNIIYNSLY